ncbi:coiled-coil domain-containing protein 105 [Platysternon megacephalum]|uniref:Coiled-coil domain-containing protein 105 n=1 Tax=Platysternon megacephalum TaxID=55544 RepID=A0A4D9DU72_9SAUR|nr:coiled-coil domain-containing protein 105 [Platysternon megacephalum]
MSEAGPEGVVADMRPDTTQCTSSEGTSTSQGASRRSPWLHPHLGPSQHYKGMLLLPGLQPSPQGGLRGEGTGSRITLLQLTGEKAKPSPQAGRDTAPATKWGLALCPERASPPSCPPSRPSSCPATETVDLESSPAQPWNGEGRISFHLPVSVLKGPFFVPFPSLTPDPRVLWEQPKGACLLALLAGCGPLASLHSDDNACSSGWEAGEDLLHRAPQDCGSAREAAALFSSAWEWETWRGPNSRFILCF